MTAAHAAPPPGTGGRLQGAALAAVFMFGASLSFSVMGIAGRELADTVNTFQLMFWRSVTGAVLVLLFLRAFPDQRRAVRLQRTPLHLLRNVSHFFGQNCWFYAIAAGVPLAQVFALEFTTPLWVAIFAPLLLGERMTWTRAIAAIVGFAGILLVLRPGAAELTPAHGVALAAAFGFTGSVLATKELTRTESVVSVIAWMTVSQMIMALVCDGLFSGWDGLLIGDPIAAFWLMTAGVCGLTAHLCITQALRVADAATVAPLDFLRLPIIAVVAALLYAEPLSAAVLFGGAIIIAANTLNVRAERRRATRFGGVSQ